MNQIAMLESLIEVLKKQMEIIEQQANDLKCCGNCRKYTATRRCYIIHPGSYCCKFWYPDGLTKIDRV